MLLKAGGVIVTLADGSHVPVEVVSFSDPKTGTVYQAGRIFNKEGAAGLVASYDGKAKLAMYVARFRQFYQAAVRGVPFESIRQVSDSKRGLSLAAQKAAYAAGEVQRGSEAIREDAPKPGDTPPAIVENAQSAQARGFFNQNVRTGFVLQSGMEAESQTLAGENAQKNQQPEDLKNYEYSANGDILTLDEGGRRAFAKMHYEELAKNNVRFSNLVVREWYKEHVASILDQVDPNAPLEACAMQAFNLRNRYRNDARELMYDQKKRIELDVGKPNLTFNELLAEKMKRKRLTREEALQDIVDTATKTNSSVNKELGIEE